MTKGEGKVFGSYLLYEKIGAGGMADVYKAERIGEAGFAKAVAIKRILPHLADDELFVNMFVEEARIAATLTHGNIVSIHDFGRIDGQLYIAMDLIDGRDLGKVLKAMQTKRRRLSLRQALFVALEICKGLGAAHERIVDGQAAAIIHRDVSPQNVLLSFSGEVKIVDFGVAKTFGQLTHSGAPTLKGKIAYMSPEQLRGKDIDVRSDIFSFGVLLYEILTGQQLFRGKSEAEIINHVLNDPIKPPSSVRKHLPPEIDRIVMKALAPNLSQRYASIHEVGKEIAQFVLKARLEANAEVIRTLLHELFADNPQRVKAQNPVVTPIRKRQAMSRMVVGELDDVQSQSLSRDSAQVRALVKETEADLPRSQQSQPQHNFAEIVKSLSSQVENNEQVGLWLQIALLARLSLISPANPKRHKIIQALLKVASGNIDMPLPKQM